MSVSPPTAPASLATGSSKTTTGGWMERKAGKVGFTKRWKRHYFAMEANSLVEYPDVQGGGLSKFYPFSQISDILIEDISKFIFSFRFRKRPHDHTNVKLVLFRVPTSEELQEWVSKLRVAVMQASDPPSAAAAATAVPTPIGSTSPSLRDRKGSLSAALATPEATLSRRESAETQASAPTQQQQQLRARGTSVLFDDEDATGGSGLEEDDSSDSDSDGVPTDYHFSGASTPTSQAPNWGTRMKRFLSRSAWDDDVVTAPPAASVGEGNITKGSFSTAAEITPPTQYDLRTFQVVEYDLVEVFENQRWFPIGGWTAKKSLLSDRAHFTSRHGHNRASLFRAGADANEATSGNEDRHEIPGTQVHVIKESWEWDSQQWVLQPLIGMQRDTSGNIKRKQSLDSDDGHRAVMSDSALDTVVPVVAATGGGGGAKAPWMKKPFHRLSTTNRPPPSMLQPAISDIAMNHHNTAVISSTSMIVEDNGHSDSTWSLGFDFTDFDHAIARGVPKKHPPLMTSNVRSRRWVRLRKRIVNITARLPENDDLAFKLFPSIVSYQRQVICEGWLGTNIRRVWKSRYLKLVRICEGSWDNGEGRGMVQRAPLAIQLICYECKERCNVNFEGIATFTLEPGSIARPAVANLEKAESLLHDSTAVTHSLTLTKNRFVRAPSTSSSPHQQAVVLDGSEESSFQMLSVLEDPNWTLQVTAARMEKPRSGRFEFAVNRDKCFIFSADSSEDSLIWVNALNRAAQEIKMAATAAPTPPPTAAPDTTAKGKKNLFTLVKNIRHHRHVMESDSDVEEGGAHGAALGNAGKLEIELEDMVAAPPSVSIDLKQPSALSNQGKLKEWEDFEMKCSLPQFFTLFYGNAAKYSMKNHHEDVGDFDFTAQPWTVTADSKFAKDEFDFDGCEQVPERLLQLQSYTKSPVGASVTRVEKHQRYYYYPQDHMLFVKSTTKSLDVPFGDSFAVYERWVVTSDPADLTKVRVRIYLEAIFSKPAGFIGTTIKRLIHVQIPKNYLQWKKRAFAVIKAVTGGPAAAEAGSNEGDEDVGAAAAAAEESESLVKKVLPIVEAIWNERVAVGQVVFAVYLMWWMHAMLLVMARLAEALDAGGHKK